MITFYHINVFSSYWSFLITVLNFHYHNQSLSHWQSFITLMNFHQFSSQWGIFITLMNFHHINEFSSHHEFSSHQWFFIKLIIFTATKFNDTNHFSQVATLLTSLFIFDEWFSKQPVAIQFSLEFSTLVCRNKLKLIQSLESIINWFRLQQYQFLLLVLSFPVCWSRRFDELVSIVQIWWARYPNLWSFGPVLDWYGLISAGLMDWLS